MPSDFQGRITVMLAKPNSAQRVSGIERVNQAWDWGVGIRGVGSGIDLGGEITMDWETRANPKRAGKCA